MGAPRGGRPRDSHVKNHHRIPPPPHSLCFCAASFFNGARRSRISDSSHATLSTVSSSRCSRPFRLFSLRRGNGPRRRTPRPSPANRCKPKGPPVALCFLFFLLRVHSPTLLSCSHGNESSQLILLCLFFSRTLIGLQGFTFDLIYCDLPCFHYASDDYCSDRCFVLQPLSNLIKRRTPFR